MWLFPCFAPCVELNQMINQPSQHWNVSHHLADCHDISYSSNHHLVVFHRALQTPYMVSLLFTFALVQQISLSVSWFVFVLFVLRLSLNNNIIPVLVTVFTGVFALLILPMWLKCNSGKITGKEGKYAPPGRISKLQSASVFRLWTKLLKLKRKHKN